MNLKETTQIDRDPFDHQYLLILLTGDVAAIPDYVFGLDLDQIANIVKTINNTLVIDDSGVQTFSHLFPTYIFKTDSTVTTSFKNEMVDLYKTARDLDTQSLNYVKIMPSFTHLDQNSKIIAKELRDSLIANVYYIQLS
jgi:hypothetical protein